MKKLLLLFVTLSVVEGLYVEQVRGQVVNIPDANFKNYLINNLSINTNGDNEIQVLEAASYGDSIDVSWLDIADLTGIEAFTSLKYLACIHNQLTSLDVSQNIALEYLNCSSNLLISLNIENISTLDVLGCAYNQLSSLNITANTSLHILLCHYNQLTSLNVRNGNNTYLTFFSAHHNPNLECITVDNPSWSQIHWTAIDSVASFQESCTVEIEEGLSFDYILYPNPASTQLTVEINGLGFGNYDLVIINMHGQELIKSPILIPKSQIDISAFPAGLYYLHLQTEQGTAVKKFVKE